MQSPQLNSQKFGAFLNPPPGGAALQVWRERVKELCSTITLAELFAMPQGPRQKYIEIMLATRAESDGFVLQATKDGVMVRTKPGAKSSEFPQVPTRVSVSEALIVFGKFGMYEQNELECSFRAGWVEEVAPTPKIAMETAEDRLKRATALFEEAKALMEEAEKERKEAARSAKAGRRKKKDDKPDSSVSGNNEGNNKGNGDNA